MSLRYLKLTPTLKWLDFDLFHLKFVAFLKKEFGKAIICISKYVHEHPNESKSWTELCLCLKRAKSYDLALEIGHIIFKTNTQANLVCILSIYRVES